jgi:sulfur carrier protein
MRLQINGEWREIDRAETLLSALLCSGAWTEAEAAHTVVALNRECVPRGRYAETPVRENDAIEILSPMQGG